ncbi:holo-[acyl-carrier protein] synthase [Maridesulfovibrio ferrireducens]|uniref:Holo-[acyl-carrier-protein] synthase n=1 Tax=Maridesulfovibrio ferrireducens TaxID=246191 RepID=A0A1G9I5R5_9BACT|nr:holo-[acyl-carrier-protein] synthase [Maridesulfovibrio ferrireducens]SDL20442.1 holo-[acyl-carrier protein] synthase [Maridesulfovibrio ferrireducens]
MIVGLGIDLTELDRIESSLEKFGERFMRTFLTEKEISLVPEIKKIQHLAARFAAKEAAVKALGTGFAEGITFKCVEILNLKSGAPELIFNGKGLERSRELGVERILISITHGRDTAAAVVILEK